MAFKGNGTGGWGRSLMASVLIACPWCLVGGPASAQTASTPSAVSTPNRQESTFSIPAQKLSTALAAFARQSGLQVTMDSGLVDDISSNAVEGSYSASDALSRLLSGTGLSWTMIDASTALISKVQVNGAIVLDPVRIQGPEQAESAFGAVPGYVASRSATATKTDTPILETPQSISVVGADEMEARNVQTLEDAIKYTPGIQLTYGATGDNRSQWYRVRGFPITTTFFRDGMRVSGQNWQRIDPYLLERTEILRGPASVLYGQSVPGGMVNAVSKRPSQTPSHEIAVEYGTSDWKRVEADSAGPLDTTGTWSYRIVAAIQDSDGLNRINHDKNNEILFAPSLTWQPSDASSVTVSVVHQEDSSRGWFPRVVRKTSVGISDPSTYLGEPNYDSYEQVQDHLSILAEHEFNENLQLTVNGRYSFYDMDYHQTWPGLVQADGQTVNRSNYSYKQDADVLTLDSHLQGKVDILSTKHVVIAGFDYMWQDRDNWSGSSTESAINLFNPVYGSHNSPVPTSYSDGDIRSPGLYLQDQISVGESWTVLLGGRQDFAGSNSGVDYDDTFTARVGLAYKTDFGLVPYASYSESFEPQSGTGWGGARFEPTTGRQYEVGVKYQPPETNLVATASLFDLRRQNVLTTDPDLTHVCNGNTCSVQTGEVKSQGAELSLTMELAENFNTVFSYTYNPIEISKSNNAAEIGRQQADTPIHTASLWMDYTITQGPFAGLGFGGGLRYIGETTSYNTTFGNAESSAQILDEEMVRYDVDDWRVSLNVKNLLDRRIDYNCSYSANAETCYVQEPLSATMRVARSF
jgi:iron complex outermembrane receptor protein